MATEQLAQRGRRSVHLDADMVQWVREKAQASSTSDNAIIRQAVRAAMVAEKRAEPVR